MKRLILPHWMAHQPLFVAPVIIVAVITTAGLGLHHSHQLAAQETAAKAASAQKAASDDATKASALAAAKAATPAPTVPTTSNSTTPANAAPTPAAKPSTTTAPATKYSTSSDPRSTAYSLTPPPANPASFTIAITHAGQVSAGTVISYNATKNEREIYAGDLRLSDATVYLSTNQTVAYVTVSSPDGAVISMPSEPYGQNSHPILTGMDSSDYHSEGTSFKIALRPGYQATSGTYQIHLTSGRPVQTADGYEYDGFITVIYNATLNAPVY